MGGADVELRGRLTPMYSRLATGAAPQTTNFATQEQSAGRETAICLAMAVREVASRAPPEEKRCRWTGGG